MREGVRVRKISNEEGAHRQLRIVRRSSGSVGVESAVSGPRFALLLVQKSLLA